MNTAHALAARLLGHLEAATTDAADDVYEVPVSAYRDPDRWQAEMERVFGTVPLVVALTAHLPESGAYRALDVAGTPVVSVRQPDGSARVFLNVCRHRGATVVDAGCGAARRFTCPYHSWTYDTSGSLVGVPDRDVFGALDASTRGLVELQCAERSGLVFAVLDSIGTFDIDGWLAGFDTVLDELGLADMVVYRENEVVGPNWKVAYDGYVDGYHLDKLHRNSLGRVYMGACMTADAWGAHQRVAFPTRTLAEVGHRPPAEWNPTEHIGIVHTVFPHVSIAGWTGEPTMVSQLFPGPTPDRSRTIQTHLVPTLPETDEAEAVARRRVEILEAVVRDEDYATGLGIQAGLASGANDSFVFGRNEPGNQHFHRSVEELVTGRAGDGQAI